MPITPTRKTGNKKRDAKIAPKTRTVRLPQAGRRWKHCAHCGGCPGRNRRRAGPLTQERNKDEPVIDRWADFLLSSWAPGPAKSDPATTKRGNGKSQKASRKNKQNKQKSKKQKQTKRGVLIAPMKTWETRTGMLRTPAHPSPKKQKTKKNEEHAVTASRPAPETLRTLWMLPGTDGTDDERDHWRQKGTTASRLSTDGGLGDGGFNFWV